VIDVFVEELDLAELGFGGVEPEATGRLSYHPAVLLKLYIYGYLNRVQSSRRLEREAGRNVEVMWLTGRLAPDHKTIADFRKDNGRAIRQVCARFVALCRGMGLLTQASVAIDGSKFNAVSYRVSHETIYRSLFVQAREALKKELLCHLRSKRTIRRSKQAGLNGDGRGQIKDLVSIRERPAAVEDRAVPGHWEGDLLSGSKNSYIATLVERHTRYVMLAKVPNKGNMRDCKPNSFY
jgi:transposase